MKSNGGTGSTSNWLSKLISYAKLAYQTGQELRFSVIKRYGQRRWRIYLTRMPEHGEDEYSEDD